MQKKPVSKVQFQFLVNRFSFRERTKLKRFIEQMVKAEGRKIESLIYIFCPDNYLLKINKSFLSHNYLTDIITFDLSENASLIGEIYISIDRVRANSKLYKTGLREELHRVIFHGILHLCGYRDKKPAEKAIMRKKEDYYLGLYLK